MHLFYPWKKRRHRTLLKLDTNNFMESLWQVLKQLGVLRDPRGSPKEKGGGGWGETGYFQNHVLKPGENKPAALLLSSPLSL